MRLLLLTILGGSLAITGLTRHPSGPTHASQKLALQPQTIDSPLEQLRDIIFDRKEKLSRFKDTKFMLVLRFTQTSYKPDSQIIVTKCEDGHTEVEVETLPKVLAAYLPDDFPERSPTAEQLQRIASGISIQRTLLRKVPEGIEGLLAQFAQLKLFPLSNQGLPIDGTRYDLWYAVPAQTIHITQHGPQVGSTSVKYEPVRWMNEVYMTLAKDVSVGLQRLR